jgi:hypothetical protein
LFTVDLQSGDRRVANGQTGERRSVGTSIAFGEGGGEVALDVAADRILLASADLGLTGIDLESGAQKQVSGSGQGPEIGLVRGLTVVPNRQFAVMLSWGAVLVVDLSTGERVIVS